MAVDTFARSDPTVFANGPSALIAVDAFARSDPTVLANGPSALMAVDAFARSDPTVLVNGPSALMAVEMAVDVTLFEGELPMRASRCMAPNPRFRGL
jgi:hypothetical protein